MEAFQLTIMVYSVGQFLFESANRPQIFVSCGVYTALHEQPPIGVWDFLGWLPIPSAKYCRIGVLSELPRQSTKLSRFSPSHKVLTSYCIPASISACSFSYRLSYLSVLHRLWQNAFLRRKRLSFVIRDLRKSEQRPLHSLLYSTHSIIQSKSMRFTLHLRVGGCMILPILPTSTFS